MAKEYNLKPSPQSMDASSAFGESMKINRRQFIRYGFNAATGVLAASLGVLGFASIPTTSKWRQRRRSCGNVLGKRS